MTTVHREENAIQTFQTSTARLAPTTVLSETADQNYTVASTVGLHAAPQSVLPEQIYFNKIFRLYNPELLILLIILNKILIINIILKFSTNFKLK